VGPVDILWVADTQVDMLDIVLDLISVYFGSVSGPVLERGPVELKPIVAGLN